MRTVRDGVRVNAVLAEGVSFDAVYTRTGVTGLVSFDDSDQHADRFGAAYLSEAVARDSHLNEYYFYRRNIGGPYSGLTGNEDRSTVGGRLWGARGNLLYDGISPTSSAASMVDRSPHSAPRGACCTVCRGSLGNRGCSSRAAISAVEAARRPA